MAATTKAELAAQVGRLQNSLDRAKAKNVALGKSLAEVREREGATAAILRVISGSPTDSQPVFDGIAASALRLIGGLSAAVTRLEGDVLHLAAFTSTTSSADETLKSRFPCAVSTLPGQARAIRSRVPYCITDTEKAANARDVARARGYRSAIFVPLLRGKTPIGTISVSRRDPGPFSDHQIELLKTFADQAVIAIENARLFNETQESLERQTATAEVLRVISSSPGNLEPVYRTILEGIGRLCEANIEVLFLYDGETLVAVATHGTTPEFAAHLERSRPRPSRGTTTRLCALERRVVHVTDLLSDDSFVPEPRDLYERENVRTVLSVPMLRDDGLIGVITAWRREVRPFSERQIDLVKTFADQAVIAIENVRLFNETKESLDQQTAISEILKVISASPTDVQPVLETLTEHAARICGANDVRIVLVDGNVLRNVAGKGVVAYSEIGETWPIDRGLVMGRAVIDRVPVQVEDLSMVSAQQEFPMGYEAHKRYGHRTTFAVPLMREDRALGALLLRRMEVRPFSAKQIALLKTFADQAAIAIENVRVFKELQARNAEITKALEQQTATADILRVISSSPTSLDPVFGVILSNAATLCEASLAALWLYDGEYLVHGAAHNASPEFVEFIKNNPQRPGPEGPARRAAFERRPVHVADLLSDPSFKPRTLHLNEQARTVLAVPLLRESVLVGVIILWRRDVRAFMEKQIALLQTFADQAVIAIENVRLFKELQSSNAELTETLEQQTATSEILRIIASSPTDTQPVFDAIVKSGIHLFGGLNVQLRLVQGDRVELMATTHPDWGATGVGQVNDDRRPISRAIATREVVQVTDVLTEDWIAGEIKQGAARRGWRASLNAPLMRENDAIGAIAVTRAAPGRFPEKQVALLKTFADQAVIAIENVRLFKELQSRNAELTESLEQQTATSEILRIISSSPTDLQPVFDAILDNARRLCEAHRGALHLFDGEVFTLVADQGATPAFAQYRERERVNRVGPLSGLGQVGEKKCVIHIDDLAASPGYVQRDQMTVASVDLEGTRTYLGVPMLKDGQLVGAITFRRQEVRPFSDKQIALLQTFAAQAVIAIENVRLFKELQAQTAALSRSVGQLTALGEVGQAISSTLDLETVLRTIVSRALQLTGLDSGSIYEYDQQAQLFRLQAAENMAEEIVEAVRKEPIRTGDGVVGRTGVTRELTQVPDILDVDYQSGRRDLLLRAGYRALIAVPLLREEQLLGVLLVSRKTPGAFTPETVDLLKTFATQSALAIQNARLFREIAEKGRQLEVASEHKSQFLASMSHELRTPLNAMLGFNEMILGEIYGPVPSDIKEPLADIQSSGKHLLRLINNVLDLAKIEAGRMELSLADYSVHETVESVRSTLYPLAAEKGLEFTVSVPEDIPFAYGDLGRITQCLMNLAGNSLKFTREGSVRIVVESNGHLLIYRVRDTGIGIPADKIESLFTEFKQTDAAIASEFGGTGLGLSITKKFVEMHGGRIWVESELAKGSEFIFEIPLRAGGGAST